MGLTILGPEPCLPPTAYHSTMSGKYAFTKNLKELRFLFCQTSDHSAAARFESTRFILVNAQTKNAPN